ncbi:hypothetical protein [Oceanobacter mangrovi]|uniref:COG4648 family protein n=1 Tax=Oceanobacter mangrovi TaxID=2862510 RepID=UPI001C8D0399|nr:hypothetical protein [Oceanobacter mangrovi]
MKPFFTVLIVLLSLCYPLAVYFGLQYFDVRYLALLLLTLGVARSLSAGAAASGSRWLMVLILAVLAGWTWVSGDALALKLYPVLISFNLLVLFGWSLRQPQTVVERLARLKEPELPPSGVTYTRKVTKVWCLFFAANGCIALATVLYGDDALWTLYNGLISYLLMGTLMTAELLVRRRVKREQHG